jgi:hypothetical protein
MFVETSRGWVALSAIRAVERSRARDTVTLFYGEETATITAPAWEMALQRAGTFIPAQPGTYLLHEVGGGEEFDYMKANVVAWTMDAQGYFYPAPQWCRGNAGAGDPPPWDAEGKLAVNPDGLPGATLGRSGPVYVVGEAGEACRRRQRGGIVGDERGGALAGGGSERPPVYPQAACGSSSAGLDGRMR